MAIHKIEADMAGDKAFGATGRVMEGPAGYMIGWGTTIGNSVQGWAPGALFINTATPFKLSVNVGSITSATWETVTSA